MQRNTRYDRQDYSALGLSAGRQPTLGLPALRRGRQAAACRPALLHRRRSHFFADLGLAVQQRHPRGDRRRRGRLGGDGRQRCLRDGAGPVRPGPPQQQPRAPPGGLLGQRHGLGERPHRTAGDICYNTDTSGFTRVTRRYYCDVGGAGSTGSTGPTGTNATPSSITDNVARWHYLGPAYQSYNEQFWTGNGTAAGFDYFMDACGRAGIYVMIRFDQWVTLFQKLNGGYQLNGSAAGSGGNLLSHRFLWPLNGTGGTVNLLQAFLDHLDQWLTRINSVNGRRYADDHTLLGFDPFNEQGMANAFFSSSDTAGSNTWDYLCKVGSTTGGATEPVSAIVAWWDAKFLAWYQATYGTTPASDYAKQNTLPTYRYNGAMGPNVAARDRYYDGTVAGGWVVRVARFIRETEAEFCTAIKNHVRSRSSHARLSFGQVAWMFQSSIALGDLCDNHTYPSATVTDSNTPATAIAAGGGKGMSWVAGTLTVVFAAAPRARFASGSRFDARRPPAGHGPGS